jgi:GNAT superfamily N-acetyltransferase
MAAASSSGSKDAGHEPLHVTTDPSALDIALIHRFLSTQSTWARGIPRALVETSIRHSLCFGGFVAAQQVAFARVVTDRATFANLVDVFVLPDFRGRGFASQLMQAVDAHPDLQGLRRFTLATADAHALYRRHGFTAPVSPASLMERYAPDVYSRAAT